MMRAIALALGVAAWTSVSCDAYEIVYTGSGNCDGADTSPCKDDPKAENVITAFALHDDGSMEPRPKLTLRIDGDTANWLTTHVTPRSKRCLFATLGGKSVVAAFRQDAASDEEPLVPVGEFATNGSAPVFSSVASADGVSVLLVSNYHGPDNANTSDGAGVSTFVIGSDCSLRLSDFVPHKGSSVNPQRQGGAHAHSFVALPGAAGPHSMMGLACDLGQDKLFAYAVSSDGKLEVRGEARFALGAGPRHSVWVPELSTAYVVSEMGMTVSAYKVGACEREERSTCMTELQTLSLVPEGTSGKGSKASEIARRGQYIYATNRGVLNTVTVFSIHASGKLTQLQQVKAPRYPRGMAFASTFDLLLVAGQSETEVTSYAVGADGQLRPTHTLTSGLAQHPATFASFPKGSSKSLVV